MKPLITPLFMAGLVLVTACNKSKTEAAAPPAPDVVGTWEWTDKMLSGDKVIQKWRLEIRADSTFRREITTLIKPAPQVTTGHWDLGNVIPPQSKDSTTDALLRSAGFDPKKEDGVYSGLANLSLFYSVPEGAEILPGSTVLEKQFKQIDLLNAKKETPVEEKHLARTRSYKSSKDIYLDFGGKNYVKLVGAAAAATTPETPAEKEVREKSGSKAAQILEQKPFKIPNDALIRPLTKGPAWVKIQPYGSGSSFANLTLELPENWRGLDPAASEQKMVTMPSFANRPQGFKTNTTWLFFPPDEVVDVRITLSVQPVIFRPAEIATLTESNKDRFTKGIAEGSMKNLQAQGYQLKSVGKAEVVSVDGHPGLASTMEMTDAKGGAVYGRAFAITSDAATLMASFVWTEHPGESWKSVMEHAQKSLVLGK